MNLSSFFAGLFRWSGTTPRRPRYRFTGPFAFEARWASLLAALGLPPTALRDVVEADSLHPHFHYRHFTKKKRDGGQREIAAPDSKLKCLQQEIVRRHFTAIPVHPAATAYRKGQSTADHAWAHAGAAILITADVQDFFPSTKEWRIEEWWRQRIEEDELAHLLTRLTTYRGGLPQGAPTSPALSNFVNHELDERLTERALAVGARYTRYCDDLAFSWPSEPGPPSDFEIGVRSLLSEFGYTLHPEKGWRVQYRRDEPEMVGVVLTRGGKVRLPEEVRRKMANLRGSSDPRDIARLAGYKGYASMLTRRPKVGRRGKVKGPQYRPQRIPRPATGASGDDTIPF
jgi:hypothetical protein